ncbi:hypothetical protein BRADI_4g08441v3 [Brachypodium distachyon]|uniref:Uncharacterized protein n=1 Tax=Brachypodium distachyon TaxID=15368 RepID=A0A2K2CL94_BRADI|nr:hypothetical protein BRADI_4g08441v3 [Brachypodium distachyon]
MQTGRIISETCVGSRGRWPATGRGSLDMPAYDDRDDPVEGLSSYDGDQPNVGEKERSAHKRLALENVRPAMIQAGTMRIKSISGRSDSTIIAATEEYLMRMMEEMLILCLLWNNENKIYLEYISSRCINFCLVEIHRFLSRAGLRPKRLVNYG